MPRIEPDLLRFRSFEYHNAAENSHKFWKIALQGTVIVRKHGRVGTKGQTSLNEYSASEDAYLQFNEFIADKLRRGYIERGATREATTLPKMAPVTGRPSIRPPLSGNVMEELLI